MHLKALVERIGDFTRDGIIISEAEPHDSPGPRIVWCNSAISQMTGYDASELIGATPRIFQGPDTSPATRRQIRESLKAWRAGRYELLNYRKDGQPFWVEIDIMPVADDTGWYRYWVSVQREITEKKAAEAQLRALLHATENESIRLARQAMVAESATDAIVITDDQGRIEWVNRGFEQISGYCLEEVVGRTPGSFLQGPETDKAAAESMGQAIRDRKPVRLEIKNYRKTGESYWLDIEIKPIFEMNGQLRNFIAIERDVSERRAKDEELQASRGLAKAILDASSTGIFVAKAKHDQAGQIVDFQFIEANPAAEKILHYARDELCCSTLLERFPDCQNTGVFARYVAVLQTGAEAKFEKQYDADGLQAWLRVTASRTNEGLLSVGFEDIGFERRQQQEIDRTKSLAKAIRDSSSVGIWVAEAKCAADGRICDFDFLEANPAAEKLLKHDLAELRQSSLLSLFPGAVPSGVFEKYRTCIETGEEQRFEIEYNADGLSTWFHVSATRTAEGQLAVGFDDIGPEKERELKLEAAKAAAEESNWRLALATKAAQFGFWKFTPSTDTLEWDNGMLQLFGARREELTGSAQDFISRANPEDAAATMESLRFAEQTGSDFSHRFRIVKPDGEVRHIAAAGALTQRNGRRCFVGVNWDITNLALAAERAQEGARAKSAFLSTMSHEIRTPMNGIIGVVDLLAREKLSPMGIELIDVIRQSGQDLVRILDDILEFSRIESDRLALETKPFNPQEILDRMGRIFSLKCQEKNIEFEYRVEGDAAAAREGDPTRITQILGNLLSNAAKFTEQGKVSMRAIVDDAGLTVEISDTGIGIPASASEEVFEAFRQSDSSIRRRFGGTGLGLSISRALARSMGGDITLSSDLGVGSVFTLKLPLPLTASSPSQQDASNTAYGAAGRDTFRILVAEDNAQNQRVMKLILGAAGLEADYALDGAQARDMHLDDPYDLILMDIAMPVLDGVCATEQIRAIEGLNHIGRTMIVAVTANAMPHQAEEYLAAGMDQVVTKPIRPDAILEVVARAKQIRRRQAASKT